MRLRNHCSDCGALLGPLTGNLQTCTSCELPFYHDAKPCAAVLVIDEAGRLLLGRRAIEPRRGLWDIPGGFCGPDETPEACAVRELHEETGCTIELTGFVAHLIDTYGDDGDHTLNAVFTARIVAGTPVAADDVAELAWFALDALPPQDELAFRNTAEAISLIRQT
jgi:ADP-ribose pyrophosphatase YjhB (NUDIX family)